MRRNKNKTQQAGFSLIELMFVISIITLISSVILTSFVNARVKARTAKARYDLRILATAVDNLVTDTGKYPMGCPVNQSEGNAPDTAMNQDVHDSTDNDPGIFGKPGAGKLPLASWATKPGTDPNVHLVPPIYVPWSVSGGGTGNYAGLCNWTLQDLASWNGPYASVPNDPWGTPYWFFMRYCDNYGNIGPALVSAGPNKTFERYNCGVASDDFALYLK